MEHSLELETVVRHRICHVCTERTMAGECGLEDPSKCALFRFLPEVVAAIESVNDGDIGKYRDALRRRVCAACPEQSPDGSCAERQRVGCALDAYLPLIVDIVEESSVRLP